MTTNAVSHAPEKLRYELSVDGALAGFTEYRDHDGRRIFFHTELDDAYAGHGLSSVLVAGALDDVRASGLRIVAVCPLVAKYVSKHHDYDDLLDKATPQDLAFLDSATR